MSDARGAPPGDAGVPRLESAVVARVQKLAETEHDEQTVFDVALSELARELGVPLAKILQLDPGSREFRVRAGYGWPPGVVGNELIAVKRTTQAGVTLDAGDTVIFDNLAGTSRLIDAGLLRRFGVISSISAPIGAGDWVYGVLSVHTTTRRRFTAHEADVVSRVASILGSTLAARHRPRGDPSKSV